MADILIKGMEMPKDDILRIEICPDGQVNRIIGGVLSEPKRGKAVALPEHGDLKDYDSLGNKMADKMAKRKDTWHPFYYEGFREALKMLDSAPTIVEATE